MKKIICLIVLSLLLSGCTFDQYYVQPNYAQPNYGVSAPLSNVKIQCFNCNGTGTIMEECMLCRGSGYTCGYRCVTCNGRGFKIVRCPYCNGRGYN